MTASQRRRMKNFCRGESAPESLAKAAIFAGSAGRRRRRAEADEVEKPVGDRADAGVEEDFGDERGLGERHGDERLAESAKGDDVL